ncbi:MAG: hypothetical protein EGQ57_00050 [Alphaproteobacteria bacterium]|nr:hypothetical protein [Alphaproteobacteria bacterium]
MFYYYQYKKLVIIRVNKLMEYVYLRVHILFLQKLKLTRLLQIKSFSGLRFFYKNQKGRKSQPFLPFKINENLQICKPKRQSVTVLWKRP